MSNRKARATPEELANIAARREARELGVEYRPMSRAKADEAERLNRGLQQMEEDGTDGEDPQD